MLETAIVTWTKQIKNVLKLDPEHALKKGDHPGPLAEIEFWDAKSKHLNSIQEQLQGEKIRKVRGRACVPPLPHPSPLTPSPLSPHPSHPHPSHPSSPLLTPSSPFTLTPSLPSLPSSPHSPLKQVIKVLDLTKSTYCSPFNRLCREVAAACDEANDNKKYLATLKPELEKLSQGSVETEAFKVLPESFRPIVHVIMLVWKHSKFYNTPARLVVLMREICNDLIRQATNYIDPATLFEVEPQEAVDKLAVALKVGALSLSHTPHNTPPLLSPPPPPPPLSPIWPFPHTPLPSSHPTLHPRPPGVRHLQERLLRLQVARQQRGPPEPVAHPEHGALPAARLLPRALPRPARPHQDDRAVPEARID